jgi:hypothetical protein
VTDITDGVKLVHNIASDPPTATINVHHQSKTNSVVGMKFDLTTGNVISALDKFCIVNTTGAVGVGGLTAAELTEVAQSGLKRRLHVAGNVMVGTHPGASPTTTATSAMVLLNQATTTPTAPSANYPGVYHRSIAAGSETTALGGVTNSISAGAAGLGVISPNFITFQTGSNLASNSLVINNEGTVSVTGRANLNGAVSVGKNFAAVTPHEEVTPIMDINGTVNMSRSSATSYDNDQPRIKLISNVIDTNADIPSTIVGSTANEIRGVNNNVNSGFLRLTAQTPANSCIDLIGSIASGSGLNYNNSVRISTGTVNRMIVNGSGNVGVGTMTPGVRLDVAGGAARVNSGATSNIALTTTGRVGINQAAPTATLHVEGESNIAITTKVMIKNPNGSYNNSGSDYVNTQISLGDYGPFIHGVQPNGAFYDKMRLDLCTNTGNNNNTPVPRISILSGYGGDGNVGIGTTTPTVKLDVAGAAKIAGELNMNSNKIVNVTTPTLAADAANKSYVDASIPIGGIIMWSGLITADFPSNWKLCDGANGTPDLRGRFILCAGQGTNLTNRLIRATGGAETVSLTLSQMPRHSHTYNSKGGTGQISGTPDHWPGVDNIKLGSWNTGMRGGVDGQADGSDGAAHENMPPFYVLAFIMRIS